MRRSNFALRLQPSLLEELRKAAELEGVVLNKLINVAVAEKVFALRTQNTLCLVSCLAEEQGRLSRRCYAQYRAHLRRSPRYAVVSFDIYIPFSFAPQFVL